jgi:preprotein translocase subunit SecY
VKKLIQTLKNIWSIEELRGKILFTLMMIAIYRLGSHIVLPGIDPTELKTGESSNGILGLIDAADDRTGTSFPENAERR